MARNEAAFDVRAKDKFSSTFDKLGARVTDFQKQGAKGFAIGAAAGVTTMALSKMADVGEMVFDKVIGGAARFQRGMLNVQSITHGSAGELESMGNTVLKIGGEFGQSAETMTKGLYDISSSGFQGAKAVDVLRVSAKAATAGLAQTGDAASGIVAVLNAYGMSADNATHVSDVLFQTVNRGVVTFPELSAEIGKTTALAAPLGVSLEEVGAGLSVMTRHGIDAENATTQLNAIMSSMLQPSKEASKLAQQLGIDWSVAGLKGKGLAGTLADMIDKTGGNQEQMAILLGDVRAIRGAFTLGADAGTEFTKELDIMQRSAGALDDAFSVQKQGLAFKTEQLSAKWDNLATKGGTALVPVLDIILDRSLKVADGFDAIGDSTLSLQDRMWGLEQVTIGQLPLIGDLVGTAKDAANAIKGTGDAAEEAAPEFKALTGNLGRNRKAAEDAAAAHSAYAINTRAARYASNKLAGEVAELVGDYKDLDKWSTRAGDAIAESAYGPEELRLSFEGARLELKDNQRELGKTSDKIEELGKKGKPVPVALRKEFNDAKLAVNESKQEVIRLGTKLEATGAISMADLRRQLQKAGVDLSHLAGEGQLAWYYLNKLANIDLGTIYDNNRKGIGGKAIGGPVQSGETYIVGEKGPELFSPSMSGYIVPNNQLQGGTSSAAMTPASGGGMPVTIVIQAPVLTPGTAQAVADAIGPALTKWQQQRHLIARP